MSVTELLYLMIYIKIIPKRENSNVFVLGKRNRILLAFALFLECFSDTILVGCLVLLEQTNSQSFWLFVLALLAIYQWLIGTGLASFAWPHWFLCLIGSFSLALFALASLAQSLIGAHWLIGSLAHLGLICSLAHLRHFWHFSSFLALASGP